MSQTAVIPSPLEFEICNTFPEEFPEDHRVSIPLFHTIQMHQIWVLSTQKNKENTQAPAFYETSHESLNCNGKVLFWISKSLQTVYTLFWGKQNFQQHNLIFRIL